MINAIENPCIVPDAPAYIEFAYFPVGDRKAPDLKKIVVGNKHQRPQALRRLIDAVCPGGDIESADLRGYIPDVIRRAFRIIIDIRRVRYRWIIGLLPLVLLQRENGVDMARADGEAVVPDDLGMPDPLVDDKGSVGDLLLMRRDDIRGCSAVKTRIGHLPFHNSRCRIPGSIDDSCGHIEIAGVQLAVTPSAVDTQRGVRIEI